jgi:hypothetical protein
VKFWRGLLRASIGKGRGDGWSEEGLLMFCVTTELLRQNRVAIESSAAYGEEAEAPCVSDIEMGSMTWPRTFRTAAVKLLCGVVMFERVVGGNDGSLHVVSLASLSMSSPDATSQGDIPR